MPRIEAVQLSFFDLGPNMARIREKAEKLRQMTRAPHTLEAYRSDWKAFHSWCVSAGRPSLPTDAETLYLFVAARLDEGYKVATMEQHIAAVRFYHRHAAVDPPDATDAWAVIAGAKRERKEKPFQRRALTVREMRRICICLAKQRTPEATRDRAVLTLGFATGLRRSNLVALNRDDIEFVERKGVKVRVRWSKSDQQGRGQVIGVKPGAMAATDPVRAMRAWLKCRGEHPGPLFTGTYSESSYHRRLTGKEVAELVQREVAGLGLDPHFYGAHSLRASFVTAAHRSGATTLAIMERTGHRSEKMVLRYLRDADPFAGPNPMRKAL